MPFYLRNNVMVAGLMVTIYLLLIKPMEIFAGYTQQEVEIVGFIALIVGIGVVLGFGFKKPNPVSAMGLMSIAAGVGIMPFSVIGAGISVLAVTAFLALMIRERYPRGHRPTFWFVYVCMLGPLSGPVLLQYLLQTERSIVDAIIVSVFGTVISFSMASYGQRRYHTEVQA